MARRRSVRLKPEDELAQALRTRGLVGGMEREYRFHETRRWRFDFAWPHLRLAVEVEGGAWGSQCKQCKAWKAGGRHTSGKGFADDIRKYLEAALLGWTVLRCDAATITDGTVLEAVRLRVS